MLDTTRLLKTRDGRPVVILSSAVNRAAAEALGTFGGRVYVGPDDRIVALSTNQYGEVEVNGYDEEGKFLGHGPSPDDLVYAEPERTSEFRTFAPGRTEGSGELGGCRSPTLERALRLTRGPTDWSGVLEIIREDGEVVDVKFHPKVVRG